MLDLIGESSKTYCDKESGCMFCDLLLCDGSRKKGQMFSIGIATTEANGKSGSGWKVSDSKSTTQKETAEIGYQECANALLKMWMDNVLTDGEYSKIISKLNAHLIERAYEEGDPE